MSKKKRGHTYQNKCKAQTLSKPVREFASTPAVWIDVTTFWCNIRPVRANELVDGQQVNDRVSHVITTRWVKNGTERISTDMRLLVEDPTLADEDKRQFHIDAITNIDDDNRRLIFYCEERPQPAIIFAADVPWEWQDDTIHTWQDDTEAAFFG